MKMSRSLLPPLAALCWALLILPVVTATLRGGGGGGGGGGWEDDQHGCRGPREQEEEQEEQEEEFCSWRCLVFTLQWPAGFCQSLVNESLCRIPAGVDGWTIHGLWPQTETSCRCWPMFRSDVQELEAELSQRWPSLLRTRSSFDFWRDEWRKHGTTAACAEGLNSPRRYFRVCLKLLAQLDLQRLLEDAGITASCDRTYQVDDVRRALAPRLGDKTEIQCVKDKQDRQVWFQVKVPLSRNFTLGCQRDRDLLGGRRPRSCPSPGHPCPPDLPFYYLPIDHQQPLQPCD